MTLRIFCCRLSWRPCLRLPPHPTLLSPLTSPYLTPCGYVMSGSVWICLNMLCRVRNPPNSSELAEFEVHMEQLVPNSRDSASSGACMDDPQWVRRCVEMLGYARGLGPVSSPSHSTMLYTMMEVDMSSKDQVVHGRASTEQT